MGSFAEPCVISINSVTKERDGKYLNLEVELHSLGQQVSSLIKREIDSPDYRIVSKYIEDKTYLSLVDFDDHLDNAENDWRNPSLD
jgi:hypothetical protein